ncbi:MAG: TIGR04282 family arsenosugar biosynthesis glycosyltransferase [Bacteroidota bacterium]
MPALLILIKNPIPGKTKTRLAADVGDEMALKMYQRLMDWTRDQALALSQAVKCYLLYSEEVLTNDSWPNDRFHKSVQHSGGLGERMEAAFNQAFADGHKQAIIIGSDCPGITTAYLQEAFTALTNHDMVIGPALDGGYTLLGLRKLESRLFQNMPWSTEQVLSTTLQRADKAGLSIQKLAPLSDVDYLEDWLSYGWLLPD